MEMEIVLSIYVEGVRLILPSGSAQPYVALISNEFLGVHLTFVKLAASYPAAQTRHCSMNSGIRSLGFIPLRSRAAPLFPIKRSISQS